MVVAKFGDETVKVQLANRLQEAIDEAAMRLGAADSEAYLAGWHRSDWIETDSIRELFLLNKSGHAALGTEKLTDTSFETC